MNFHINDICYFLKAIGRKSFRKNGITKNFLYQYVERHIPPGLKIHFFNFDEAYQFGLNLNLYIKEENRTKLTAKGLSIVNMKDFGLDLTPEQKEYIVENCIFENKKFENITKFLKKFVFQEDMQSFVFFYEKAKKNKNELTILLQFDVIKIIDNFCVINSDYTDYLEQAKEGIPKSMTQKELETILAEQKRIGDLAEKLTVEYEKKRLRKNKLNSESKKVKKISTEAVNKGYDVESFSKKSEEPNLFIEVKGRKWDLKSFIISINEINTAKRLGRKYVIYFWNNIGSKNPPKEPLKIIYDPHRKLSFDECENCLNFLVKI